MSEPLTEDRLREYRQMADDLASYRVDPKDPEANFRYHDHVADYPPEDAIRALLAEVGRLKARNATLEADFAMRNITAKLVLDAELGIEEEDL